jgi:hypothetical protein
MSKINDGGPAFARSASEHTKNGTCPDGNDPRDAQEGMTLRDWFAGQALIHVANWKGLDDATSTAQAAFRIADAMIAEREVSRG